jgi:hypothetical protein
MTSSEFITWLRGFVTACHEYAPTPKQWDILKDELDKVSDPQTTQPHWKTLPVLHDSPQTPKINPMYVGDVPGWMNPWFPGTIGGNTTSTGTLPSGSSISFTNTKMQLND